MVYVHSNFTAPILPYHFIAITITMMALDFIRKRVLNINVDKSSNRKYQVGVGIDYHTNQSEEFFGVRNHVMINP